MGFFINEHQHFSGNASVLASLASQCAHYLQLPGDLDKINERIVRYYVAEGLVDRPERIGRDAQYDYKHLLQFLAGRFLVESGFPMQKVAPYLMTQSISQLEALVMNRNKPNMAELLVASFQRGGGSGREGRSLSQGTVKRDFRKMDRSDEDRSGSLQSRSLPSNSVDPRFYKNASFSEMHSADMSMQGVGSPRDHVGELHSQIDKLTQSMREQFDRIRFEIEKERARSRDEHERERFDWRKEREILHSHIDELNQSMREQFDRIRYEMEKERARSRKEQEEERLEWRKEREALQQRIDQLIAIVAKQNKGKDHE
jgi:hypothetical protein